MDGEWKELVDPELAAATDAAVDLDAAENDCPACGERFTTGVSRCPGCGLRLGP